MDNWAETVCARLFLSALAYGSDIGNRFSVPHTELTRLKNVHAV